MPISELITNVQLELDESFPGVVLEGQPTMSTGLLWQSEDGSQVRGVWRVTPGTFTWTFSVDEIFVVHSGRGTIRMADGTVVSLSPGTIAIFAPGDESTWSVDETILKTFHIATP